MEPEAEKERLESPARRRGRSGKTRRRRLLILLGFILCLPVLIPLSVISFPVILLFAVRWTRRRSTAAAALPPLSTAAIDVVPLLDRYLEDQMGLVRPVALDCCRDGADLVIIERTNINGLSIKSNT